MSSSIATSAETNGRRIPAAETSWLEVVEQQVNDLKFGSVHITVHEGRVVQVETSVRLRFEKSSAGAA